MSRQLQETADSQFYSVNPSSLLLLLFFYFSSPFCLTAFTFNWPLRILKVFFLLQIHLFAEPFCVILHRHLSNKHPLNELLKYHCRGLIATNTIGSPSLVSPNGYMDKLTTMGYRGTVLLVDRGYKTLSWKDADFHLDIKVNKFYTL